MMPPTNTREFDDLLSKACEENESAVASHGYGDPYLSSVFTFTRSVKAIARLKDATAEEALEAVDAWLLRKGYSTAEEGWQDKLCFGDDVAEDVRVEFIDVWEKIRFPAGYGPLEIARDRAQVYRLRPKKCPVEGYAAFISLSAHLQRLQGEKPILLPCRQVGVVLNVSAMTVSRYRRWALKDGQLKPGRAARFYSELGKGEAAEFRFDLSRYPTRWRRGVTEEISAGPNSPQTEGARDR